MKIKSLHPLDDSFPAFLDQLDSEPDRARADFCEFAYRLLAIRPPRVFGMVRGDRKDDLIQDVLLHCLDRDCRVLRCYRDQGRPFAAWLLRVAANLAVRRAPKYDAPPEDTLPEPVTISPEGDCLLTEVVKQCLRCMGQKCQFLLRLLGDGLKPAEMAGPAQIFLGTSEYSSKQVSDDVRYCKSVLRNLMRDAGVDVGAP